MTATSTMNGKPQRKQLGDQLDRLDSIIDALAEGLPGAVADACRDGARLAVKDAIIEILSNPELRAMLTPMRPEPVVAPSPAPVPEEPKKPGLWSRIKARIAAVRNSFTGATTKAKSVVTSRFKAARSAAAAVANVTGEVFPVQRVGLVAFGVGLVVGVGCLMVPQTAAAVVGGVGAAFTAVGVQTGHWLKRVARRFGLMV